MTTSNNRNLLSDLYDSTPEELRQELIRKLCKDFDCSERVFYNKRKGFTKVSKLEERLIKKLIK